MPPLAGAAVLIWNNWPADKLSASLEFIYVILRHGSLAYDPGAVRLGAIPNFTFQSQSLLLELSLQL